MCCEIVFWILGSFVLLVRFVVMCQVVASAARNTGVFCHPPHVSRVVVWFSTLGKVLDSQRAPSGPGTQVDRIHFSFCVKGSFTAFPRSFFALCVSFLPFLPSAARKHNAVSPFSAPACCLLGPCPRGATERACGQVGVTLHHLHKNGPVRSPEARDQYHQERHPT